MRATLCLLLVFAVPARAAELPAVADLPAVAERATRTKAQAITGGVMLGVGLLTGGAGLVYRPCPMTFFSPSNCSWVTEGLAKYGLMIGGASLALAGAITFLVAMVQLSRLKAEPPPPEPELRLVPPPPTPLPSVSFAVQGPAFRF